MEIQSRRPKPHKPAARGSKTCGEGRVNIPLGAHKERVREKARQYGATETMLVRCLIIHGLDELDAGRLSYSGPQLAPPQTQGGAR